MTTNQAWVFIQSKFGRFAKTGLANQWTHTGICYAIIILEYKGRITEGQTHEMKRQLLKLKPQRVRISGGWWFPIDRKGAVQRLKLIDKILRTAKGVEKK